MGEGGSRQTIVGVMAIVLALVLVAIEILPPTGAKVVGGRMMPPSPDAPVFTIGKRPEPSPLSLPTPGSELGWVFAFVGLAYGLLGVAHLVPSLRSLTRRPLRVLAGCSFVPFGIPLIGSFVRIVGGGPVKVYDFMGQILIARTSALWPWVFLLSALALVFNCLVWSWLKRNRGG